MKTPLLLLPGLLCDQALWAHQLENMNDVADSVVTDMTRDSTMAGMAKRILDSAPERFALCGLSMGGYCALEIMRQAPERVERLALLDTSARPDTAEQTERRLEFIETVQDNNFEDVLDALLPLFILPRRQTEGDFYKIIRSSATTLGQEVFIRQQQAIMSRGDGREILASINCPSLILCGDQDALTPPDLHHEMAQLIPNATLNIVEDCGHLAPLERPQTTTAALKAWLEL
jgi:pimeloyl-ACP methyl ester carboxylesterase